MSVGDNAKLCVASKYATAEMLAKDDETPVGIGEPLYGLRVKSVRLVGEIKLDSHTREWFRRVLFCRMAPDA